MAGSLSWITDDSWPSDEGWPYPDADAGIDLIEERPDIDADADDDLVSLHAAQLHLFDDLDPLERQVVLARFGFDGRPPRSMRDIQQELGLPRPELRLALGAGLTKLRNRVGEV
jgi:DNA-directed RNA polymerase sigma subunit (sigma70/sigma32)